MLAPETSDDLDMPVEVRDDRHIVVELRVSGPAVHDPDRLPAALPSADVAELRDRVAALERALAGADARIEALSHVFSAAVEHFASVQPPAREAAPPPAPGPAAPLAPAATAPLPHAATAPLAHAAAAPPPGALAATPEPALRPAYAPRPKSRGLRRLASVLRRV